MTTVNGTASSDTLEGSVGPDTLVGGLGDDTYVVNHQGDTVTEDANGGSDLVRSGISYVLGNNVENLTLIGSTAISATGNALGNLLTGNAGANLLDGGAGVDTLRGGGGDDIYVVDNAGDTVTEEASAGTDLVRSVISYVLGNHLENLTLTGTAALNGTGNGSDNALTGNGAANLLEGGAGNDILDGGAGVDTLRGGGGDDVYVVEQSGDVVTEDANAGTDLVRSVISYVLGNYIENLTLAGVAAINGTGNGSDNALTGNSAANLLEGGAGNDTLDGGAGVDTLRGGGGDDVYVVDRAGEVVAEDANGGSDLVKSEVSYVLGDYVENLTLIGTSARDGTGNASNNVLTGNAEDNLLDGGAGVDTMRGGGGDDVYVVDHSGDMVIEEANAGKDLVRSVISFVLGNYLENLTLTGTSAVSGTGNGSDNALIGNSAANLLDGGAGNDTLDGGAGVDTLRGGGGDDVYTVDRAGDVVTEDANAGTDLVRSVISYVLGSYIENLTLAGVAAVNGTGNASNNALTGNGAANLLDGGAGNDTLDGGAGVDTLRGGGGDDAYVVDRAGEVVAEDANGGSDLVQSGVSYVLGDYVENLTLTGTAALDGTGNAANNVLIGNAAANLLDGGAGVDTLQGGGGDDVYLVDQAGDVVIEGANAGTDLVRSVISYVLGNHIEKLTLTGTAAVDGTGNASDNTLTGNSAANLLDGDAGNDTLDGGAGVDTLRGGGGDDAYVVDNANDVITEEANAGTDLVRSVISYVLGNHIENLTLSGMAALSGTGNESNNVLTGNSAGNVLDAAEGTDTLDGGAGADTLRGGGGDDVYVVDNTNDVVTEGANAGTDLVRSVISYVLGTHLENLTLSGSFSISATGNASGNVLVGNAAANVLDGGAGVDTMRGGGGDDVYVVDELGDVVSEDANAGSDLVRSAVTFALGSNIENLILTGGALNGTGNASNNALTGNGAANVLDGGAGKDTLDGGEGADTLRGGGGDDVYVVDDAGDVAIEDANAGTDLVRSVISYVLGNAIENLTLAGTAAVNGTGNASSNALSGNSAANLLDGGAGNDTLDGGAGADTLHGGGGDDAYVVDDADDVVTEEANAGTDLVRSVISYVLGNHIENLTLTGTAALAGTGNASNNVLTGNAAANLLDGGAGVDTMRGGGGDDAYVVDNAFDVIAEDSDAGSDQVQSSISYVLGSNLENLTLTGEALNGTGNAANNALTGNGAANRLEGGAGNDSLDGGAGVDTLRGGGGDDVYVVDNANDVVTEEANAGTDLVRSVISYVLGNAIENLTLAGTAAVNGTGNAANNALTGNGAANVLDGGAGTDTLDGGAGADTLRGGGGDDVYIVDNANDVVTEELNAGTDLVRSVISFALGNYVEDLTLSGTSAINGTGNALGNALTGNAAANVLDGGAGVDTMRGGGGDDGYVVDNAADVIVEDADAGSDQVQSSINYVLGSNVEGLTLTGTSALNGTGNAANNTLTGNSAANLLDGGAGTDTLDGGAGVDTLRGGGGDDVYVVDNANDVVTEEANAGTDLVRSAISYVLGTYLENLTLTGTAALNGTGNASNNALTGNGAANLLEAGAGNDTLDGGAGVDTLRGGGGDDVYMVDNASDVVTEDATGGSDLVRSSISYVLGNNIEKLTLTGTAAVNGTGNAVNNAVTGNAGANVLDGGAGADTLLGGGGDDAYVVDNVLDVVTEDANAGSDLVRSSIDYVLGNNLENLILTGTLVIHGTGNTLDNLITGNAQANTLVGAAGADTLVGMAGNDTLDGGAGADSLTGGTGREYMSGGLGNDIFVFAETADSGNTAMLADVIRDFAQGQDRIDLSQIDAFAGADVNDAFLWRGTSAFSSTTQGELRYEKFDNNGTLNDYTIVYVDTNADTSVEMAIRLNGLITLVAGDFLL